MFWLVEYALIQCPHMKFPWTCVEAFVVVLFLVCFKFTRFCFVLIYSGTLCASNKHQILCSSNSILPTEILLVLYILGWQASMCSHFQLLCFTQSHHRITIISFALAKTHVYACALFISHSHCLFARSSVHCSKLMEMWQSSCNLNFIIVIEFIMMLYSLL